MKPTNRASLTHLITTGVMQISITPMKPSARYARTHVS